MERIHLFPDSTISPLDWESSTGVSTDGDSDNNYQKKGARHKKKKKSKKAIGVYLPHRQLLTI